MVIQNTREQLKALIKQKSEVLSDIRNCMVKDIHYAERITKNNPEQLEWINWAPRKAPESIQAPGTPDALRVVMTGAGEVIFDWQQNANKIDYGRPQFYVVERRAYSGTEPGSWQDVATSIQKEITLSGQPQKVTLEYRVRAVNKTGASEASTTITIVL